MKKEKLSGFLLGILVSIMALTLVSGAFAASGLTLTVDPTIKVMVNGAEFHPKDVNGNDVMVFVYNGTTYAPLRALAEAYGLEVGYDSTVNMATVNQPATPAAPSVPAAPTTFTLGVGSYVVGTDIPAGKYDVTAISGFGNFQGRVASRQLGSLNELLAAPGETSPGWSSTFSNLTLANGDTIEIKGNLSLEFTAK